MLHLTDKKVSIASVVAASAWLLGGAVVVAGLVTRTVGLPATGLWISAWGIVLVTRQSDERSAKREHDAFEMGRTVGAAESLGRDLHSV